MNIKNGFVLGMWLLGSVCCWAGAANPIFSAVRSGDRDEVERLISKDKTLVFATDERGMTPFLTAVESQDVEMAYLLADYFSRLGDSGAPGNAMHIAVNNEDEPMLRLLLRLTAAEDPDLPKYLLNMPRQQEKAAPRCESNDRNTPLHLAAQKCNFKIYKYLLANGANPLARNAAGKTPKQLLDACPKPVSKPAGKTQQPVSSLPPAAASALPPEPMPRELPAPPLVFPVK